MMKKAFCAAQGEGVEVLVSARRREEQRDQKLNALDRVEERDTHNSKRTSSQYFANKNCKTRCSNLVCLCKFRCVKGFPVPIRAACGCFVVAGRFVGHFGPTCSFQQKTKNHAWSK